LAKAGQSEDSSWHVARGELLLKGSKTLAYSGYPTPYSDAMLEFAMVQGIIEDPFVTNFAIERGRYWEDPVRRKYHVWCDDRLHLHGDNPDSTLQLERCGLLLPPIEELRFFGSSPDGKLRLDTPLALPETANLEIKVGKLYNEVRSDWMAQIQMEMLMSETNSTHLVFTKIDRIPLQRRKDERGNNGPKYRIETLRRMIVPRDDDYLRILLQRTFTFVACHLHNIPPFPEVFASLPKLPMKFQNYAFVDIPTAELKNARDQSGEYVKQT
jgi:hypothetical protein